MMLLLPWPARSLSPNARDHWRVKWKAAQSAKETAYYTTLEAKAEPCANFRLTFCPPDNRARDLDNLIASMKPALDGMAKAWRVDDSTFRFSATIGEACPGGRVIVEVEE